MINIKNVGQFETGTIIPTCLLVAALGAVLYVAQQKAGAPQTNKVGQVINPLPKW